MTVCSKVGAAVIIQSRGLTRRPDGRYNAYVPVSAPEGRTEPADPADGRDPGFFAVMMELADM